MNLFTCAFSNIQNFIYIDAEAENVPNIGQNRCTTECYIQEEGCLPTTTYPADISDKPWERNMAQCTLERCQQLHAKLRRDLWL